jgi:hypothetical protein
VKRSIFAGFSLFTGICACAKSSSFMPCTRSLCVQVPAQKDARRASGQRAGPNGLRATRAAGGPGIAALAQQLLSRSREGPSEAHPGFRLALEDPPAARASMGQSAAKSNSRGPLCAHRTSLRAANQLLGLDPSSGGLHALAGAAQPISEFIRILQTIEMRVTTTIARQLFCHNGSAAKGYASANGLRRNVH